MRDFFGGFNSQVIAAVLILVLLASTHFAVWYFGRQSCLVKEQAAVIKEQFQQDKAVQKVQQQEIKRQIVYRERLQVIHDATDNCLPSDMPPDVLRQVCAGSPRSCPGS